MSRCPFCGHPNREGDFFCEDCGQPIHRDALKAHRDTQEVPQDEANPTMKSNWGTSQFSGDMVILLHVRDSAEPIEIRINGNLVIGRIDADVQQQPDLDLTAFGALEKGVSRRHAILMREAGALSIIDIGSANGTYLNGQRIAPQQPRVLRDGDEIRFGKLLTHLYFHSRP